MKKMNARSIFLTILRFLPVVTFALLLSPQAFGGEVTFDRLLSAAKDPNNWLMYLRTYDGHRYSPLSQINRKNVKDLVPAWAFQPGKIEGGFQATPIVVDGVMYISSSWNRVFALDAATGKEIWHYYHDAPKEVTRMFFTPYNRGVAVGHGKVYMGTIDARLIALDMKTGEKVWDTVVEDWRRCSCNITGAPLVVKDKVIVGITGGELPIRCHLSAYDASTGKLVWRWYIVPGPGEPGNETWGGDSWKYGGGSAWMTGSYDPELNLLYWGTGNPAPDYDWGGARPGDNLYTDSVVALDPDTGQLKWYFQEIPHDTWDFDSSYEVTLLDVKKDGKTQKLLVHQNKGGFVYVLDRTNGKFINAWPVMQTYNFIKGVDAEGKPIGRNEPVLGKPTLVCPAIGGGRQWGQASYSPKTSLYYTTGIEWCEEVTVTKQKPVTEPYAQLFFGGEQVAKAAPSGIAPGHLDARDPTTGAIKWQVPFKYPTQASVLATGGDLVFIGDSEGVFHAFDAETGAELWSFRTGSGFRSGPVTYTVNGKQYIAVASGWGGADSRAFSAHLARGGGLASRSDSVRLHPQVGKGF